MITRYSREEINSIWQDEFKFKTMLEIELLSLEAWEKLKKIPQGSAKRIRSKARFNINRINEIENKTHHDIVAFVTNVGESIGKDAQYLHFGLTSSDIIDTTTAVQLKAASEILIKDLEKLLSILAKKAKLYRDTICIGRTHGVHAEPTTFGLKLALWYDETKRNIKRLKEAAAEVAVGKISGAVGTYANVDPRIEKYICNKLKNQAAPISTQVIPRDGYAHYLAVLAVIGSSLEKFALEIRHLQRTEVLEAEEPFAKGQKGSSAMPHKRNPVICERICGLSRILRANAQAGLENVALWHERDISHSSVERVILPDSTILLDYMLYKFTQVIEGLLVYPEHMLENLIRTKGLIFSQRVLLSLMDKGVQRMKAYEWVQRLAMESWQGRKDFKALLGLDKEVSCYLSAEELDKIFDLNYYLRYTRTIFKNVGLL